MYKSIRGSDLKGLLGRINIIDIRKNYLYKLGNIPTSKNIPSAYLLMDPDRYLNRNECYYIYCTQGIESVKVCDRLSSLGFDVINVLGGYHDFVSNY